MKAVILKANPCTNSHRDEWEILVPVGLLKFWQFDVQAGPWPEHAACAGRPLARTCGAAIQVENTARRYIRSSEAGKQIVAGNDPMMMMMFITIIARD